MKSRKNWSRLDLREEFGPPSLKPQVHFADKEVHHLLVQHHSIIEWATIKYAEKNQDSTLPTVNICDTSLMGKNLYCLVENQVL